MDTHTILDRHLQALCQQIGERFIGTTGNHQAADYIDAHFQGCGLATHRLCVPCPAWRGTAAQLYVNGKSIPVQVNTFSPTCTVAGKMTVVYTLEELQTVVLTDRVLIMGGELTQQPINAFNTSAVYLPEQARQIGLLLRQKRPLAAVMLSQSPGYVVPLLEDMRLDIPTVTVAAEDGVELLAGGEGTVRLTIESEREESETCNVIGVTHTGRERRLILCAHYDSRYNTIGAFDNASGVAALLTLAELYAHKQPAIALEFVAFTAEEYQVTDSFDDPYLKQYGLSLPPFVYGQEISAPYQPSALDQAVAVLNFDGIGHALSANTVTSMACSDNLKHLVTDIKQQFPSLAVVGGWPASNHYAFYANGIPSIPFSSVGMNNVLHHPRDEMRYLSIAKLVEVVTFAEKLVAALADKDPAWSRAFILPK